MMNFAQSIIDSIERGIKTIDGTYPNEICTYCIGSGSNFTIHKNVSIYMANNLYKEMKNRLPLGTNIEKLDHGSYKLESWHCMESNSGIVYTFMFPITEIIEHNPNDIIDEWIENNKKHKEFMNDLLSIFIEKKEKQKNEICKHRQQPNT